jgi:RNA polymerase sigma-70 factor (ECF subfamily)
MTQREEQGVKDLELMRQVAANQDAGLALLYERFGSLVYRMAFQAVPARGDAEDAVQEIFVRLWRTADRYDPKRAALVTWVILIARRQLVDRMRRTRARIRPSSLDEAQSVSMAELRPGPTSAEREERLSAMLKKIDSLPELQKTVVTRAYLGGQTLRQIGEELNTPLGTIKSALSRALTRLRERTSEEMTT